MDRLTNIDPIRLRSKMLKDGRQSLYLDIYWAGKRSYQFLKLYLRPGDDAQARTYNAMMLKTAHLLKTQKLQEVMGEAVLAETGGTAESAGNETASMRLTEGSETAADGTATGGDATGGDAAGGMRGMPAACGKTSDRMRLTDWMMMYRRQQERKGRVGTWQIAHTADLLVRYKGAAVTLAMVDKGFCQGFADYLLHGYRTKCGKPLSRVTAANYFGRLHSALNAAVRAEYLAENPMGKLDEADKIRATARRRCYLTIDEVKRLIATDCPHPAVKQAFLFSCFCGLRLGDIHALKWRDFVEEQGRWHLDLVMRKTREPLYLPVSEQARRWLPEGGNAWGVAGAADVVGATGTVSPAGTIGTATEATGDALVFNLPSCVYINVVLKRWAQAAGIGKNLHFHVARHTFATMMLTLGADLYTTSKLLGHTDIGTTQIYAQIINPKKDAAVDLANAVFGG